jgi:uncharacterized membrane protein YwzB
MTQTQQNFAHASSTNHQPNSKEEIMTTQIQSQTLELSSEQLEQNEDNHRIATNHWKEELATMDGLHPDPQESQKTSEAQSRANINRGSYPSGISSLPSSETPESMRAPAIKNMEEYGFSEAGSAKGNTDILLTQFNLILRGHLTDEQSRSQLRSSSKEQIRKEIEDLESEIKLKEMKAEDLENRQLPELIQEERAKKAELDELTLLSLSEAKTETGYDAFTQYLNIGFMIALFLLSWFYYYLLTHNGLYRNIGKEIMESIGNEKLEILYTGLLNPKAFTDTPIMIMTGLLLIALLFPAMGLIAHSPKMKRNKLTQAGFMIMIIIIDSILAYKMDKTLYDLRYQATNEGGPWHFTYAFTDISFYLILSIGIFSYLTMGYFINAFQEEKRKCNPQELYQKKKSILNDKLSAIKESRESIQNILLQLRQEIEKLKGIIRKKHHDLNAEYFNRWDCERMMDFFLKGWMRYLSGMENGSILTQACMQSAHAFKQKHLFSGNE